MARTTTKRNLLDQWLADKRPRVIDEELLEEIRQSLAPVSPSYLRRLIRDCGYPATPLVEGVRQSDLAELERTLVGLQKIYQQPDAKSKQAARRLVLEAKQHARLALGRGKLEKQEAITWMTVWLENPGLFETWAQLRKSALAKAATESQSTQRE